MARHAFDDRADLAQALSRAVAGNLAAGLAERGEASLAVSGGSTPDLFFEALSQADLDWDRVTVTLVDERWVGEDDERSNARLVRARLLTNCAAPAQFAPLYMPTPTPQEAVPALEKALARVPRPFDAVVLGMGTDGHTASFFPGADRLAEALAQDPPCAILAIEAPGAGEPRMTWTLRALIDTRALYLHIEGAQKMRIFEDATADGPIDDMPVRAVLRQCRRNLELYWSS